MSGPPPGVIPPPPQHPLPPGAQQQMRPGHPPQIIQVPQQMRPPPGVDVITEGFRHLGTGSRVENRRESFVVPPNERRTSLARTRNGSVSGPVYAKDGAPCIYEGWTLTKVLDTKAGQEPRWNRVVRTLMNADHSELRSLINKSKERKNGMTGFEQYSKLEPNKQAQVDRLIEDRKKEDKNPSVSWGYGLIERIEKDVRKNGKVITETRALTVVLRKKLPREAQFPQGILPIQTKLSNTTADLDKDDKDKDKKDKDKDKDKDKKKDTFATPGSTISNPDGRRFFVGQDGNPIPIDQQGRPVVVANGPPQGPFQGPHPGPMPQQGGFMPQQGGLMPQQGGFMPQQGGLMPQQQPEGPLPPHMTGGGPQPQIQVIDDNMVPGPPPRGGGQPRKGHGVPPIQIPPPEPFMD
jgi:hypothetical protein